MIPSIHFQFYNELGLITERIKHLAFFSPYWGHTASFFSHPHPALYPKKGREMLVILEGRETSMRHCIGAYHSTPLVSRNQETHLPPHLHLVHFLFLQQKRALMSAGCRLCKGRASLRIQIWKPSVSLGNLHSSSHHGTSGGLGTSMTKKPRNWTTFRGCRARYIKIQGSLQFLYTASNK